MHKKFRIFKAQDAKIIPGEMSDMDINMISLVRKGSNKQKIQIYKADDESEGSEETSFFQAMKDFFLVNKADKEVANDNKATKVAGQKKTFSGMMAIADVTENMWRANDTLRSVMRDIINNEEIADKKVALLQAIDEYAEYMKDKVSSSKIAKSCFFEIPDIIAKAVKDDEEEKDSSKEGEQINPNLEDKKKNMKNQEEIELKKEDMADVMKAAIDEALEPINKKLDSIEKSDNPQGDGTEQETEDKKELAEVVKSAIKDALAPIDNRIAQIEKSRGIAKSQEGEEHSNVKKDDDSDLFDGFFA